MAVGGPTGGARVPRPVLRPGNVSKAADAGPERPDITRAQVTPETAAPPAQRVSVDASTQASSRQRNAGNEAALRAQLIKEQADVTAARGQLFNGVKDAVRDGRLTGEEVNRVVGDARNLRLQTREADLAQARVDLLDAQNAVDNGGGRMARRQVAEAQARVDSLSRVVDALGGNSAPPASVTVGQTQYRGVEPRDLVLRDRFGEHHGAHAMGVVWRLPKPPMRPGTSTFI